MTELGLRRKTGAAGSAPGRATGWMARAAVDPQPSPTGVSGSEQLSVLMRRLAFPLVVVLLFAQVFFMVAFLDEPLLTLALVAITLAALVNITVRDYRADMRQRALISDLQAQQAATRQEALAHNDRMMADVAALARGAVEAATVPATLTAQLAVLTPLLTDLLATRSRSRRQGLVADLELGALHACCELIRPGTGGTRAVFYRRMGRRMEPWWWHGDWASPPAGIGGAGAQPLRLVLSQGQPAASVNDSTGELWSGTRVPLHVGRHGVGVLCVERQGDALDADEVHALVLVARIMTAAFADGSEWTPPMSIVSPRRGRSQAEPLLRRLDGGRSRTRADTAARLASLVREDDARRAVRQAFAGHSS